MAQASSQQPTYLAREGSIFTSEGQRLSLDGARELRRFFLDDMVRVEERFGDTDPETADVLFARDLRLAIELRQAINEASAYRRPALRLVSA